MNITILTLGSRGDVQPYVVLGEELVKRGHSVTICTGGSFRKFIEERGIKFEQAHTDFMELVKREEGRAIMNGKRVSPFKMIKFVKEVINPSFRKSFDDFLAASRGADLIIYHPKASVAEDIGHYMRVPVVSMSPVPMVYPVKEFPNLALAPDKDFGHLINRLSYSVIKFSESSFIKEINDFRQKKLHMKSRKSGAYTSGHILYPISRYLFEDVTSWEEYVKLSGFLYLKVKEEELDDRVSAFLKDGDKPWIITFSSMPAENMSEIFSKLLKERGERAIFISGNSDMKLTGQNILTIKSLPHRLVFREARGIIHHGGVGTTAEALLSGIPQHIIPFNVDQPFWARRLKEMGLMGDYFRAKNITKNALNNALESMLTDERFAKAQEIMKKIKEEDGAKAAADYIESCGKLS